MWRDKGGIVSMGDDVLQKIKDLAMYMKQPSTTLAFLGGEATILGIEYFEHFEEFFSDLPHRSHIQSNMTLLTDDFCEFFKKHNYTVGSSLDGVPEIHNVTRDNSFSRTLEGIIMAKEYGILSKVLCTITNDSMNYLEEMFEMFAIIKTSTHFNAAAPILHPNNYHEAMGKLYEMWFDFGMPFHGLQFSNLAKRVQNHKWWDVSRPKRTGCMGGAVQIDWTGSVVMCSQLAGNPRYQIGNVLTSYPVQILMNENRWRFFQETKDVRTRCQRCVFRFMCNGGCLFNAKASELSYDPYCGGGAPLYKAALDREGISMSDYMDEVGVM